MVDTYNVMHSILSPGMGKLGSIQNSCIYFTDFLIQVVRHEHSLSSPSLPLHPRYMYIQDPLYMY